MQQRAPAVYEWVARLWNCKCSRMPAEGPTGFPEPGALPDSWGPLLKLLPDYLQYYSLNAQAYRNGASSFDWNNKVQFGCLQIEMQHICWRNMCIYIYIYIIIYLILRDRVNAYGNLLDHFACMLLLLRSSRGKYSMYR